MDHDELLRHLRRVFLDELEQQLVVFQEAAAAVDGAPADGVEEAVRVMFRVAHSLKGAAREVSVRPIERACHALESVLGSVRDGKRPLGASLVTELQRMGDALAAAGAALREGRPMDAAGLTEGTARLDAVAMERHAAPRTSGVTSDDTRAAARTPPTNALDANYTSPRVETTLRVDAGRLDSVAASAAECAAHSAAVELARAELEELRVDIAHWRTRSRVRRVRGDLPSSDLGGASVAAAHDTPSGDAVGAWRSFEARLDSATRRLAAASRAVSQHVRHLEDDVLRTRMVPLMDGFRGLDRLVRDVASAVGKEVQLTVDGGSLEVDRAVAERLRDPLRHLVRNAVDHGIEAPEIRERRRKPVQGALKVRGTLVGTSVRVEISDDGGGVDVDGLRRNAQRAGVAVPDGELEAARLAFHPGLTTAREVTHVSGRGVGLDSVRATVEALGGHIEMRTEAGVGTTFAIVAPITLSTSAAVFVRAGGEVVALPSNHVRALVRGDRVTLRSIDGREKMLIDGEALPVASLAALLGLESRDDRPTGEPYFALLGSASSEAALHVDAVVNHAEIVVKPLSRRLPNLRLVIGATTTTDGGIAIVLSGAELVRAVLGIQSSALRIPAEAADARKARLLVVDDSLTTRTLVKTVLETEGFEVIAAADGVEGWERLQRDSFDLVVTDIEMPRLNGFELCERIRARHERRNLPVILLTGLGGERDRTLGMAAGADAYLVKNDFDQRKLIDAIRRLL